MLTNHAINGFISDPWVIKNRVQISPRAEFFLWKNAENLYLANEGLTFPLLLSSHRLIRFSHLRSFFCTWIGSNPVSGEKSWRQNRSHIKQGPERMTQAFLTLIARISDRSSVLILRTYWGLQNFWIVSALFYPFSLNVFHASLSFEIDILFHGGGDNSGLWGCFV